jgi:hypothetical protein
MSPVWALFFILLGSLALQAQTRIEVSTDPVGGASPGVQYRYLFENERFLTPRIEVAFGADGRGQFRFTRKGSEEVVNELKISPVILGQVRTLLAELRFLESAEDYQHKKDFSHLGRVTISYTRDGRTRTATFNYTENQTMSRLVEIFRGIATQETRVFEIETVRASDPLSTPAHLRLLENELRSKHIADPERLVALLQELRTDESVPLIARNHAERLLKEIKKGK